MTNQEKSHLFEAYNAAKPLARRGLIDGKRLNKALGIAQRKQAPTYITTNSRCTCPDFSGIDANGRRFRSQSTRPCKHILAFTLSAVAA